MTNHHEPQRLSAPGAVESGQDRSLLLTPSRGAVVRSSARSSQPHTFRVVQRLNVTRHRSITERHPVMAVATGRDTGFTNHGSPGYGLVFGRAVTRQAHKSDGHVVIDENAGNHGRFIVARGPCAKRRANDRLFSVPAALVSVEPGEAAPCAG